MQMTFTITKVIPRKKKNIFFLYYYILICSFIHLSMQQPVERRLHRKLKFTYTLTHNRVLFLTFITDKDTFIVIGFITYMTCNHNCNLIGSCDYNISNCTTKNLANYNVRESFLHYLSTDIHF